ncbi:hypothetical protein KLER11_gp67 [Pararheinheimera phage vB_PsoM_KLER1-1]|nr:hypothetical protein KLER11_gp67 [Pararheinheimera phage vB_PsoM_KLER1-1]
MTEQVNFPSAGGMMPASVNAGAVSIEQQRAIAEVHGKIFIAKSFPRNELIALQNLLVACGMMSFAEEAFYNVPRAGGTVSGPSIRLAEEIARCYGHMDYGHRELSRDEHKSEIEVYAWDMQNNNFNRRQITVMHVLDYKDKKTGQKMSRPLHDQKDIDDKIANVAAKQMRGRILALVPKSLVAEATLACRNTIAGLGTESIQQRIIGMTKRFATIGVTVEMLETYLGHPVASVTTDEIADLFGVYNAIAKEGIKASEYFGGKEEPEQKGSDTMAALNQKVKDVAQAGAVTGAVTGAASASAGKKKEPVKKADPVVAADPEPEVQQGKVEATDEIDPFENL